MSLSPPCPNSASRCRPVVTPQRCQRDPPWPGCPPPGPGCPPPAAWVPLGPAQPGGRGLGAGASQSPPREGQQVPGGWGRGQPGHGQVLGWVAPTPWGTLWLSRCQPPPQPLRGAGCSPAMPPPPPLSAGPPKARGGPAHCPPATRQPRARATTVPSGHPPAPSAPSRATGRIPAGGTPAPRGKDGCCWEGGWAEGLHPHPPCLSFPMAALPPAGAAGTRAAPPAAGSGCKPGPAPSRLRAPRKTAVNSTPR